ncbi:MAG: triacylglycerol lipase [Aquabacterium sp.]|nr:MAG: triacylglycerol lipase [Aquabacterium sp.]
MHPDALSAAGTRLPWPRLAQALAVLAACLLLVAARPAAAADTYAKTRYPVVLVHGLLGYDEVLGYGYFYRIPDALRAAGATVYVASLPAVNDDVARGEALLRQLRQWAAAGGHTRFNLVGHSQGGTTARYVAGVAPPLVASVTSIGTPHTFDGTGNVVNLFAFVQAQPGLVKTLADAVSGLSGHPELRNDVQAAIRQVTEGAQAFNARFPAGRPTTPCGEGPASVDGIRYYSATGNVAKTNAWDPVDLLHQDSGGPSDGFMPVCITHWGQVIRDDYPWNHYDEINQVFGLIGRGAPDPSSFYLQQANRLKGLGL